MIPRTNTANHGDLKRCVYRDISEVDGCLPTKPAPVPPYWVRFSAQAVFTRFRFAPVVKDCAHATISEICQTGLRARAELISKRTRRRRWKAGICT